MRRNHIYGKENSMTQKRNLAYIKKRVLACLDEYDGDGEQLFVTDGNRQMLESRMADALTSSLVRMYESLPMPTFEYTVYSVDDGKGTVFEMPKDFGKLVCVLTRDGEKLTDAEVDFSSETARVSSLKVKSGDRLTLLYKRAVPIIDNSTDDSFELELEPLAFEALICLAASELCGTEDSALYAKLIYKYRDLCEGFYEIETSARQRNGFFAPGRRKTGVR